MIKSLKYHQPKKAIVFEDLADHLVALPSFRLVKDKTSKKLS